jgi:hypothetical protein
MVLVRDMFLNTFQMIKGAFGNHDNGHYLQINGHYLLMAIISIN